MNSLIVPCGILRTAPLATCASARILCHFSEAEMLDLKFQHCIIKSIIVIIIKKKTFENEFEVSDWCYTLCEFTIPT